MDDESFVLRHEKLTEKSKDAFKSLMSTLKIQVPIVSALMLALVLGWDSLNIQGFNLPRLHAAILSLIILIFLYLGIIRIIIFINKSYFNLTEQNTAEFRFLVLSDTSMYNPMYAVGNKWFKYFGSLSMQFPVIVLLVVVIWTHQETKQFHNLLKADKAYFDSFQQATEKYQEYIDKGIRPELTDVERQEYMNKINKMLESSEKVFYTGLAISFLSLLGIIFMLIYIRFLLSITKLISLVISDSKDSFHRVLILWIPGIIISLTWMIIFWMDNITMWRISLEYM